MKLMVKVISNKIKFFQNLVQFFKINFEYR